MMEGYDNQAFKTENGASPVGLGSQKNAEQAITYSWSNINVFATTTQGCGKKKVSQEKHILKDVSGIVRPGELLAIMGASGAGKTTLLNVLTFRSDLVLKISGKLYANGQRVIADHLTSRSAYVQQEDLFIGTFTVREQLMFQAMLRMDTEISYEKRVERVDEVMQELSLVKCSKTLIGIPGRIKGISGGETKRLAVACEMLTNPALMFLDEPTSGLDSFMAQSIVQSMKDMASKGKTIISTIHQPSSEVFALFDRVLLMGEGKVAYLGSSKGALEFFSGMGYTCPKTYNPADFFILTLAIEPEREAECKEFVNKACDAFHSSSEGHEVERLAEENTKANLNSAGLNESDIKRRKSPYKANWFHQFRAVMRRSFLANIRAPMVLRAKVFQTILISLLVGLVYLDQSMDMDGVSNINGALFLLLTQISFSNAFGVINEFCMEVPVFLREHFNGMYRTDVYFLTKNLAELPFTTILPMVFVGICYYMIGLYKPAGNFFICCGIMILVANAACSYGYMVSCMAKDINMALAISAPLLIPLMLFGGYFLNSGSVPDYFIWIKYISWFSYGNEALMINQWTEIDYINCTIIDKICYPDGLEVLKSLSYDPDNLGFDLGLLAVLIVGYRTIGFLLLLLKTRRKTATNVE